MRATLSASAPGLPPLARGALDAVRAGIRADGPTPACAGSTMPHHGSTLRYRAYPRLRGEHLGGPVAQASAHGLPPLARGARPASQRRRNAVGPTPACAGSTATTSRSTTSCWAYPRLRGEHVNEFITDAARTGLPPLARGAPARQIGDHEDAGPTPACAGSTTTTGSCGRRRRAYPRLRGEHMRATASSSTRRGLPPLARGALVSERSTLPASGPTPACAGSTARRPQPQAHMGAYPRLRGEHAEVRAGRRSSAGLPPLARGAPARPARRPGHPGPTPACAGSTGRRCHRRSR